jgi:hypothetical protein
MTMKTRYISLVSRRIFMSSAKRGWCPTVVISNRLDNETPGIHSHCNNDKGQDYKGDPNAENRALSRSIDVSRVQILEAICEFHIFPQSASRPRDSEEMNLPRYSLRKRSLGRILKAAEKIGMLQQPGAGDNACNAPLGLCRVIRSGREGAPGILRLHQIRFTSRV